MRRSGAKAVSGSPVHCAGNNTIAALLAGAVDEVAAAALEVHLDRCGTCRELVARLGRGLSAIGEAPSRLPAIGARIGRYEVRRVVGAGGMGVVYEARDPALDRRVALKLLRPELAGADLLGEALSMARLQHPNIVGVFDVGTADGQLYICMEYVDGTTLRAWARGRGWREILEVYRAAGEGLAYVHRAKLAHLDFKPDNVLVDRDGRARVTDFGLARVVDAPGRPQGGTPAYMAPEQRRGEADARSDQYAFCASLAEALGGRGPATLHRALDRGRAARPADRFASMTALLDALVPRRRRFGGLVVIAATAALAFAATRPDRPAPSAVIPRPTTRIVDWALPMAVPVPVEVERRVAQPPSHAAGERTAPARVVPVGRRDVAPAFAMLAHAVSRAPSVMQPRATASAPSLAAFDDGGELVAQLGPCDDSLPSCTVEPPECAADEILAVQDGCWTCADEQTCMPHHEPWVLVTTRREKPAPRPLVHAGSSEGSNAGPGSGNGSGSGCVSNGSAGCL